MIRPVLVSLMTLSLLFLLASQGRAAGTGACLPHDDMRDALAQRYHEQPLAMALTSGDTVLELFTARTGTWTITVTRPGGPTCIIAAGSAFSLLHRDGLVPDQAT